MLGMVLFSASSQAETADPETAQLIAHRGYVEVVELLDVRGTDLNQPIRLVYMNLIDSARTAHRDLVESLIDRNLIPDVVPEQPYTHDSDSTRRHPG